MAIIQSYREIHRGYILNMLKLSGVPLTSAERSDDDPLVIAGGPCVVNPEPLADFIDIFVIGESEEAIKEIIKRGKRELKDILHDYEKKQISYSAYNDEVQWFRNIGLDTVLSDLFDAFDITKGENYNDLYMELGGIKKKWRFNRLES